MSRSFCLHFILGYIVKKKRSLPHCVSELKDSLNGFCKVLCQKSDGVAVK